MSEFSELWYWTWNCEGYAGYRGVDVGWGRVCKTRHMRTVLRQVIIRWRKLARHSLPVGEVEVGGAASS